MIDHSLRHAKFDEAEIDHARDAEIADQDESHRGGDPGDERPARYRISDCRLRFSLLPSRDQIPRQGETANAQHGEQRGQQHVVGDGWDHAQ